ncbi:homospermidine synthase [Sulfuricella sp.]|uniref:homospermidine synthase n=1 Tax=Sulfuricella sp. TaxID=2099377 RepID=UPI002BFA03EC|nr:saccharopine dehydrogenase C-terminal domain-containing protein [Sulfuricella sp.]HUX64824.1 saccharopine dehydrogenase C-terminal domain-containing protein [Sulfuricella sp.]
MKTEIKHAHFPGNLLMVGFGCIGQATLPLLFRHLDIQPQQIRIVAANEEGAAIASESGVAFTRQTLTRENYRSVLEPLLGRGDFLLNLSVDISSLALIELCRRRDALYLDASIEPWAGGYTDSSKPVAQRTNNALREDVLGYGRANGPGPTAVVTQGANPGLVSMFVKQALLDVAADSGVAVKKPARHEDWARLACLLGIKAIHIAERDTQTTARRKRRGEFVNTWSVEGFISEGLQPAELGWGTHERHWPADGARHESGCDAVIYLNRPGAATQVRSWTPLEGPYHGLLITHGETISIADHLTLRENGAVVYRPTVHYAYQPCDDALLSMHEMAGRNWQPQRNQRIIRDEITAGMDELGVLLMGNAKGVYWYGSRLSIEQARQLAPYNNATSMQVAAGVLAGMVWALRNPRAGVVEPDDLDHETVLEIAKPYLGEVVGVYGDWTPLRDRGRPISEELDRDDPWQFSNVRVT